MTTKNSLLQEEQKLSSVLREDFHRGNLKRSIKRDYNDLKEYFLDEHRKQHLEKLWVVPRWLLLSWWLVKALLLKLTPPRRIALLVGCLLIFFSKAIQFQGQSIRIESDTSAAGALILLFVLMLELKDKLVAREELESGRAIQSALMPERSPSVDGWSLFLFSRTANEVGGDLVDFQEVAVDRFGISLADVAGKGLRAALLMAKLQASLRALAPDNKSLSELGKKINQIFYRDGIRNIFASLVYLEIGKNSGKVHLINAGHIPPIVIRRNTLEELSKGKPAIGIFPETEYTEEELTLERGESVLIYSDGLTDAKNETGEFYGSNRVQHLLRQLPNLSALEMGESIVREIDRFIGEAKIFDDLSLILLKRTG
ncbi:MAG: PP2C family protein-serine/threonine phosphatase [Bacteroidota bacterium]